MCFRCVSEICKCSPDMTLATEQILQVVEALLKQKDLLISCGEAQLPPKSPAAVFLTAVLEECGKGKPQLGRVIKVCIPATRTNISISPQRRIQGLSSRKEYPLQRYDAV